MPSKIEELEQRLPFLPGHTFGKHFDNHRKSHCFDYLGGVPVVYDNKPGIGNEPNAGHVPSEENIVTSVDLLKNKSKVDSASKVPGWIAFEKQVLRFHAYFKEEFPESSTEPFRIRKVNIYFYIEDDSMHVSEPRIPNSGLPQGTLIRRHRITIPNSPTNQHYTFNELNVGKAVRIYARDFHITGCDQFTRKFLQGLDIHVPSNFEGPADPYQLAHPKVTPPKAPAQRLIPTRHTASLKKFLMNDRHVLRFYCIWDDSSAKFGEVHSMVLHYFLADDTVEIREQHIPTNSAHAAMAIPNTVFLKRHRLPKRLMSISADGSHLSHDDDKNTDHYYTEKDFFIGGVVNFYGRTFIVCDCDASTREYYQKKYGIVHYNPIQFSEYGYIDPDTGAVVKRSLYPFEKQAVDLDQVTKFSTSNNAPKSIKKKGVDDNVILRFTAKLLSEKQVDKDRKFILSYYFVDDSFQVFERQMKNSGIKGGKFLERSRMKKADGRTLIGPSDIAIGEELVFWSHRFLVTDADEFTKKFIKQNAHLFTKVSPSSAH